MSTMESPIQKWVWGNLSEVVRSLKGWFGFLYGVALIMAILLRLGTAGLWEVLFALVSAILGGLVLAHEVMQIRDNATLRTCIVGAFVASIRTLVIVIVAPSLSAPEVFANLLIDGFLGARIGYGYTRSPRKVLGSTLIGGVMTVVGMAAFVTVIEPQSSQRIVFEILTFPNGLVLFLYGTYGGGIFGLILAELEAINKKRELEFAQQKPFSPSLLTSSLGIIPMLTGMVTYKGTGIVRFRALELKVNRIQYQGLKLGLTYKIEYNEHENRLLGYELVSKETPVVGGRF